MTSLVGSVPADARGASLTRRAALIAPRARRRGTSVIALYVNQNHASPVAGRRATRTRRALTLIHDRVPPPGARARSTARGRVCAYTLLSRRATLLSGLSGTIVSRDETRNTRQRLITVILTDPTHQAPGQHKRHNRGREIIAQGLRRGSEDPISPSRTGDERST